MSLSRDSFIYPSGVIVFSRFSSLNIRLCDTSDTTSLL